MRRELTMVTFANWQRHAAHTTCHSPSTWYDGNTNNVKVKEMQDHRDDTVGGLVRNTLSLTIVSRVAY